MGRSRDFVEGTGVELREVFRPLGAWNFDSPILHADTKGTVEAIDPRTRAVIVRFPGHLPVRVPRALLKVIEAPVEPAHRLPAPPPGL